MTAAVGFDPVPGPVTIEDAKTAVDLSKQVWVRWWKLPATAKIEMTDIKVWRRANGDGYIVCASIQPTVPGGPGNELTAAISISTGKFPGGKVQPIYDEDAYNLIGCNTTRSTTIP